MTAYVNAVRKDGKIERRGYRNQDLINTLASNPSSMSALKVDSASSAALSAPHTNVVPAASDVAAGGGVAGRPDAVQSSSAPVSDGPPVKAEDEAAAGQAAPAEDAVAEPVISAATEPAVRRPRLVDCVIAGLCGMLGEELRRREPPPQKQPSPVKVESANGAGGPISASGVSSKETPDVVMGEASSRPDSETSSSAVAAETSTSSDVVMGEASSRPDSETSSSDVKPEKSTSPEANTNSSTSAAQGELTQDQQAPRHPPRPPLPDLTPEELPRFTPLIPGTRDRPLAHRPMTFLDMIPVSLTATYPRPYREEARAYAEAVRRREAAIVEAQEAKDDHDDAREKYASHTEAWNKMLENQRGIIERRKRDRERKAEAAKKKRAAAEAAKKREEEAAAAKAASTDGSNAEEKKEDDLPAGGPKETNADSAKPDAAKSENSVDAAKPDVAMSEAGSDSGKPSDEKKDSSTSTATKKSNKVHGNTLKIIEDPLDCMPPKPRPPGPFRPVAIPDIPVPPAPPTAVDHDDRRRGKLGLGPYERDEDGRPTRNEDFDDETAGAEDDAVDQQSTMRAPRIEAALTSHLDPSCLLPTRRYFGLLSNSIADPLFVGPCAPGIAGVTYGGGTGLATAYAGGGRTAPSVVAAPGRAGSQTLAAPGPGRGRGRRKAAAGTGSGKSDDEVDSTMGPTAAAPKRKSPVAIGDSNDVVAKKARMSFNESGQRVSDMKFKTAADQR